MFLLYLFKNEKIKIEEDYSSSAINASIPNAAHSGHTQSSGILSPYFFYQHCQYNFNCIDTYI